MLLTDGRSNAGGVDQPRVVQLQISRYLSRLPRRGDPLEFLVALHVEGTPITWQRNAVLRRDDERRLLANIDELRLWSASLGSTLGDAQESARFVGTTLRDVFLGRDGADLLADLDRTALLLMVDETVLHLPWELMLDRRDDPLVLAPLGRVVTTRTMTAPGRDPADENPAIRILAVENPTEDLASSEQVMDVLAALEATHDDLDITVESIARRDATVHGVSAAISGADFDIVHFAGHGMFDPVKAGDGALVLADGVLTDEDVLNLDWARPPFVIINSSCESARSASRRRLVSNRRRSNGLASAFLSRGVEAYLGHYFFVEDSAAADFTKDFYATLLRERNVGSAVQVARRNALGRFLSDGDLTGLGVVFFGDAGTAQRRDLATAA